MCSSASLMSPATMRATWGASSDSTVATLMWTTGICNPASEKSRDLPAISMGILNRPYGLHTGEPHRALSCREPQDSVPANRKYLPLFHEIEGRSEAGGLC